MSRFYSTVAKKSPFEILSLPTTASSADIKRRYYELAKTLHPDKPTGNVEEFQKVVRAYELLSDPARRSVYLRTGLGWDIQAPANAGDPWGRGNRPTSSTNAYWATDDLRYKDGPWSTHANPRFMKNGTFISIVAGLALVIGIVHFANVVGSHSHFVSAADRHHMKTSDDLARARTEAQLFGNQRAIERVLENRMKYFRSEDGKQQ
ncbi:DnaJ domain-containing protein [Dichotomocladium elegans]|nr:DnaJ domain-containing protein [Dichotomocladium elegans]